VQVHHKTELRISAPYRPYWFPIEIGQKAVTKNTRLVAILKITQITKFLVWIIFMA